MRSLIKVWLRIGGGAAFIAIEERKQLRAAAKFEDLTVDGRAIIVQLQHGIARRKIEMATHSRTPDIARGAVQAQSRRVAEAAHETSVNEKMTRLHLWPSVSCAQTAPCWNFDFDHSWSEQVWPMRLMGCGTC